jgi:SAM-dependent methyltransferase
MSSELTDIYDRHVVADVFSRYHQNSRLAEILAREIAGGPTTHHLSIGFSGRLSLFDALAESLTVINLSAAQLELGIHIQRELLEIFADPSRSLKLPMKEDIERQIAVLRKLDRTPVIPRSVQRVCLDITENMELVPASTYTSVSIIDVLLHVAHIEPVIRHLHRVLKIGGKAILTVYPPGGERHLNGYVLINPALWSTGVVSPVDSTRAYYRAEEGYLDLQAIRQALEDQGPIAAEVFRRFWLDLPGVYLHPASEVVDAARESGLLIELSEAVPGGMFPVEREVFVLSRGQS